MPGTAGPLHVTVCLPQRATDPCGQPRCGIGRRDAVIQQISSSIDPLRELVATRATTASRSTLSHVTNVLLDMSHLPNDTQRTFHPAVVQRHLEAEVAHCVGGVLSPLLANIALEVLDEHFAQVWASISPTRVDRSRRRRHGLPVYRLVRYADDFVVLVSGTGEHAEAMREQVAAVIAPMGLRLSPEKTTVVTSMRGSTSSGSASSGTRSRAPTGDTSTPFRRGSR